MVDKVDMSLDEIIALNKKKAAAGGGAIRKFRGGRRGSGRGPPRVAGGGIAKSPKNFRRNSGGILQRSPFARSPGDIDGQWQHDMFDGFGARLTRPTTAGGAAKLNISNLHYEVSDLDIAELFSEFGPLKSAAVHYDRSGRSFGFADVVFERRVDALRAIQQYNGVPLDGRPMRIVLADEGQQQVSPLRNATNFRRPRGTGARRGGRGGGAGGGGSSGGNWGARGVLKTAEELDAELDAYVKQSK